MEKERADTSVSFYVMNHGNTCCGVFRTSLRGFSPIFITAALSVVALIAVVGWQITGALRDDTVSASYSTTTNSDSSAVLNDGGAISTVASGVGGELIGDAVLDVLVDRYLALQEQGLYTQEVGEKSAEKMAEMLKVPISFRTYTQTDITTSADTSYARMLAYRSDLQISLAPLLKNTEPEYEIFAYYVSTKDRKNLEKLQTTAQNYRAAANATARVIPPKDALKHHLDILNALGLFAATLDTLVANADDPFASVVFLRSYNEAEADVLLSFASLAKYYREKRS